MQPRPKNPQKFKWIILSEVIAGATAAFAVSPLNVVVDKSVIECASTKRNLWQLAGGNLKDIVKTPVTFFKGFSFRWMYFVYIFTYSANNLADHLSFTEDISHPIQKLGMVFLTNTTCSLIKDKKYAVKYGLTEAKKFPIPSYGLFFLRDLIAMASAFTIPPILGKEITTRINVSKQTGEMIAQLISPVLVQFVATPIHLLALDLYNRPGQILSQRFQHMKTIFKNTLLIRMMRFLPAYGFGGIINTKLRSYLKKQVGSQ